MAYTTAQLITNSYYLSGVVRRGVENFGDGQLTEGLSLLNEVLAIKTANQRLIPYFKEYSFLSVPGQEAYFIPGLILLETLTFFINNVRYSMFSQNRRAYFGSSQAENVTSLPYKWHVERCLNGSNIYIYFKPDQDYPMVAWGKFSLPEVTLFEDLLLKFDRYYVAYLKYGLAEYICQQYNFPFLPQNQERLKELEQMLVDISPLDMTVARASMFSPNRSVNYGIANLSNGWTVP